MKKQETTYSEIKGLITDVNINVNPGNPTFQNFYKTPIGKLAKRKGWNLYWRVLSTYGDYYMEQGKDNGNIIIDYDRLTSGTGGYPDTATFHVKKYNGSLNTANGETYAKDYTIFLRNKIVNDNNELWRYLYASDLTPNDKKISDTWEGRGNKKFIETPDHVYIINDYQNGITTQNVLKYKYNRISMLHDDVTKEVKIGSNFKSNDGGAVDWEIRAETKRYTHAIPADADDSIPPLKSIEAGTYHYMFLPVYNTGAVGDPIFIEYANTNETYSSGYYASTPEGAYISPVTITRAPIGSYNAVAFYCKDITDPFISFIKIYRTKNLTSSTATAASKTKFYFVGQAAVPQPYHDGREHQLEISNAKYYSATVSLFYGDNLPDSELGTDYLTASDPFNKNASMRASCGCYAQNRLFLAGDRRYPANIFLSELDKTDLFILSPYTMPLASLGNETVAIENVGTNIFVFQKNSFYILRPTSDADVPYIVELVSPSVGCDSLNSITVLDNIAYFMFNNKLWALNEFSQFKEISGTINTQLDDIDTANPAEVILKTNTFDRYIKIMYRKADGDAVNIDYYPIHDLSTEQTGDKDIYTKSGTMDEDQEILNLNIQTDNYKLVNYEQLSTGQEWGVEIDGNIVIRTSDWEDTFVGKAKTRWLNYIADSTAATNLYSVNAVLEKPWAFSATVKANCVVIYGTGPIDVASAKDGGAFSAYKTYTMTRTGVTIPLNLVGHIISVRLRHTANTDIDYDFMKLVYTPYSSVDVTNDVSGGE
jgi:hypothetical protein